jgi:hypothetical protein
MSPWRQDRTTSLRRRLKLAATVARRRGASTRVRRRRREDVGGWIGVERQQGRAVDRSRVTQPEAPGGRARACCTDEEGDTIDRFVVLQGLGAGGWASCLLRMIRSSMGRDQDAAGAARSPGTNAVRSRLMPAQAMAS